MNQIRISGPFHVRGFLAVAQLGSTFFFREFLHACCEEIKDLRKEFHTLAVSWQFPAKMRASRNDGWWKPFLQHAIYIWYIYYIYKNIYVFYLLQLYCHICAHLEKYIHVYFLSLAGWLSFIWHVSPRKIANQASRFFFRRPKIHSQRTDHPSKKKQPSLQYGMHNKCLFQQNLQLKKHVLHTTHTILFMFVCYALLDHQWNVCWPIGSSTGG